MGTFFGHALPGSFFILVGLWWFVHVVLDYATTLRQPCKKTRKRHDNERSWRQFPSSRWRNVPFEPLFKILVAFIGICVEMYTVRWSLVDERNAFHSPNKFAHASMYSFFALSGLIELLNFCNLVQLSLSVEYIVFAGAFGFEGMLFGFHLHGRSMFDIRVHTLLFILTFLTASVILLEACLPKQRRELFMARTVLCLTQGTWFWEIAFTLYSPRSWVTNATDGDLMKASEVITAIFCWHILGWCGLVLISCVITSCLLRRKSFFSRSYFSSDESESFLNGDFPGIEDTVHQPTSVGE